MKNFRFSLLVFLFITSTFSIAKAQNYSYGGTVLDAQNDKPLASVTIIAYEIEDTTKAKIVYTDAQGKFLFKGLNMPSFKLKVDYFGYTALTEIVDLHKKTENSGIYRITPKNQVLNEVIVVGQAPTALQKGDTVVMNASAFKTNPDANAEDLVKKMPSISIDNTGVKAQGESVQHVLVDGKPFFGDDPSVALRNLPADLIDKVEVFDKLSDQSELTGYDDGQTSKTLNLITRKNAKFKTFGKIYGGYSNEGKYQAGESINLFRGSRRISIIGLSNNINQQNFSSQDLLGVSSGTGGGGRGRGGNAASNFMIGQQNGISTTNSVGLNYTDIWANKISVTGSYFFNYSKNNLTQSLNRQYVDSSLIYKEDDQSSNRNYNHRLNFKFEYTIDSTNSIIMVPSISLQSTHLLSTLAGFNFLQGNETVNQSNNNGKTDADGYNLSNNLTYRHKFSKKGRTLSLALNSSENNKDAKSYLQAQNGYYINGKDVNDSIDQFTDAVTKGYSIASNLMYTEPIGKSGLLQVNYGNTYTKNKADKLTYDQYTIQQGIAKLDTSLSNKYDNDYVTNRAGIGYRLRISKFNGSINLNYQHADLSGSRVFPSEEKIDRTFENLLPMMMVTYKFSKQSNLRFNYRASTNAPSITQLQNVIDNSNPLMLSTGNPDLKQEYSHNFTGRFSYANPEKSTNFFAFLNASYTLDPISSSTFTARKDSILARGVILKQGARLTQPINLDHTYNVRSWITYGFPLHFIKCNLNLNTGFTYSKTPGLLNGVNNFSDNYALSQGVILGSNISEKVDFTLSYNGNYNIVQNTMQPNTDNNYFSHTASFKVNVIIWKGFVLQNDLTNQLYRGLSSSNYNQDFYLWNAAIGKKFLKENQGEFRLSVFDLLNQNSSISRNITGSYIEDSRTNALKRYLMLTFTYTIKS
jgi:hypothetical protein